MRGLRGKLTLANCFVVLLCLGITAVISFQISSDKLGEESTKEYNLLTEKTAEEIDKWITEQAQLVVNNANAIEIMDEYDQQKLTDYLTPFVNDYNTNQYIYDLYYTSSENIMSSGSGYVPDGSIDFTKRDWYLGALDTDNLYYSTPYVDTDSGKIVITISKKVEKMEQYKVF